MTRRFKHVERADYEMPPMLTPSAAVERIRAIYGPIELSAYLGPAPRMVADIQTLLRAYEEQESALEELRGAYDDMRRMGLPDVLAMQARVAALEDGLKGLTEKYEHPAHPVDVGKYKLSTLSPGLIAHELDKATHLLTPPAPKERS